jgi:hypothetical protein
LLPEHDAGIRIPYSRNVLELVGECGKVANAEGAGKALVPGIT